MILDIPTHTEFKRAALSQIFLAWAIAIGTVLDLERQEEWEGAKDEEEKEKYWEIAQPVLSNAYTILQQSIEFALKGRIAEISPYLLINRDPKELPKPSKNIDISFSDLRSIDASELLTVYNAYSTNRFDKEFIEFWDKIRKERNKIIHSVSKSDHKPRDIILNILNASKTLFNDRSWPEIIIEMQSGGGYPIYGTTNDYDRNNIMAQMDAAIRQLSKSEALKFLNFDKGKRSYVCPHCWYQANRDAQDEWPKLAQLKSKKSEETNLICSLCGTETEVSRNDCYIKNCKGNVIFEGICLTCLSDQEQS